MWLKRFIDRVLAGDSPAGDQLSRVEAVLDRRGVYDDHALLEALLAALPAGAPLTDPALARVARALRVRSADELDIEPAAQLDFWATLAARFPDHAHVHAFWGDALRDAGRQAEGLDRSLDAVELEPALFAEFADDLEPAANRAGGLALVRYQIAELRARLEDADPDDADDVRERYSELLEDHRDDPAVMARVRALGAEINRLVADDKLPRAFVRRTR